jgi:hypothetical protein
VKSIVVNITEQKFGFEVEGSDCGDCLVMFMNMLVGTMDASKYCLE